MVGFAFVKKDSGNVDYIISWDGVEELPEGYPVDEEKYDVVKIQNYNNDLQNYQCYNSSDSTFNRKLEVTIDKARTLIGGTINIQIAYPDAIASETAHLSVDGIFVQDVYIVNGRANISYAIDNIGINRITVTSSTHYGENSASVEVLN